MGARTFRQEVDCTCPTRRAIQYGCSQNRYTLGIPRFGHFARRYIVPRTRATYEGQGC